MTDHLAQAQLVKLRIDQLMREARATRDTQRLAEIEVQMDACLADMEAIREEQLREDIARSQPKPSWWRRLVGAT